MKCFSVAGRVCSPVGSSDPDREATVSLSGSAVRRPASALAPSGLGAIERGSITIRMEYAEFEDYWEPLLRGQNPVGAYVASLSQERRRVIEERVRLSYFAGCAGGPRSMTAAARAVRGTVP